MSPGNTPKSVTPMGFLNINKPKGITSFDVIYKLRKILGMKKIGHTGTLDPLATGVLPIALGSATKLIEYLEDDKKYTANLKFGEISTTYDEEGEKTPTSNTAKLTFTRDELEKTLQKFKGKIKQTPPIYSAIKVGGKKLYELARAGKTTEIPEREIEIYNLKLLEFRPLDASGTQTTAKLEVHCSSGTYIRSLAHDIGQALGCGAYLTDLKRTKSGSFEIENSIEIEAKDIQAHIINPAKVLPFRQYELNENEFLKIKNGNQITVTNVNGGAEKILLTFKGILISIATQNDSIIRVDKVFNI